MEKIQFTATGVAMEPQGAPIDVLTASAVARVKNVCGRALAWYNSKSEFYSQVLGEHCSWKTAIRVNAITLLIIVMTMCAMENLIVTGVSLASAGWLTYRLNTDLAPEEKQGEEGGRR